MTCGRILQQRKTTILTSLHLIKRRCRGSSPTMISVWGVTPLLQQGGSKIQGGSSPTMISEWGVTPSIQRANTDSKKSLFFSMIILFPNNNNNNNNMKFDHYLTCRLPPQVKRVAMGDAAHHRHFSPNSANWVFPRESVILPLLVDAEEKGREGEENGKILLYVLLLRIYARYKTLVGGFSWQNIRTNWALVTSQWHLPRW